MVVGGYAVRFHGCRRESEDLDILVHANSENATKIARCLSELGACHVNVAEKYYLPAEGQENRLEGC